MTRPVTVSYYPLLEQRNRSLVPPGATRLLMVRREMDSFADRFVALTGYTPFPWQETLFDRLLEGHFPETCAIPTGIGKTSAMAVWLLALAVRASTGRLHDFPRRLVYVVNRRTVVDQATADVETWRRALNEQLSLANVRQALRSMCVVSTDDVLAISTLRGQRADNAAWRLDPARAAIVIGTVDMIGSRLLFAGYGCGFRSKPLHAAFLGQDVWVVHDEAHLEPAFQELLAAVRHEQRSSGDLRPFVVTALTATPRHGTADFQLTPLDRSNAQVRERLRAPKALALHPVDQESLVEAVVERVLQFKDSGQAILVYLRTVEDVDRTCERLAKAGLAVEQLTGTLRGLERDRFARENRVFARFSLDGASVEPALGTVCLVCTSAGEVGVNMSADHMVSDLTPFDSMAQRLGRVNRLGRGGALVDVFVAGLPEGREGTDTDMSEDLYAVARARTAELLRQLPLVDDGEPGGTSRHDASPAALESLPADARRRAFSPSPVCPPTSEVLFDAWALTSIRDPMPGRPPVEEWLHGVAPWDPPETAVAWRMEVELLSGDSSTRDEFPPEDLLEDYPLKPHELLRDRSDRVLAHLKEMAARLKEMAARLQIWVIDRTGLVTVETLQELTERGRAAIEHRTVVLPPSAGGLAVDGRGYPTGRLAGRVSRDDAVADAPYDVADMWVDDSGRPQRQRVWDEEPAPAGMRLVRTIPLTSAADDTDEERVRVWRWYVRPASADDQGSRTALTPQELGEHHRRAGAFAGALAHALALPDTEATAIRVAASLHDLGKSRAVWQRSIRNTRYPAVVLAKSGHALAPNKLSSYRHELGSLIDIRTTPDYGALSREAQDLVEHLIGAHHGRGRPMFPRSEIYDPERAEADVAVVARDVMARYGRLQRRYGRWGLAFLESLVRSADVLASNPEFELPPDRDVNLPAVHDTAARTGARAPGSAPTAFQVHVNPLNPGEFLACCGLLEIADRLSSGAAGWFDDGVFRVRTDVSLADVVSALVREEAEERLEVSNGLAVPQLIAPLIVRLGRSPRGVMVLDGWVTLRIEKGRVVAAANRPWNFWSGQQTSLRIWRALREALIQQTTAAREPVGPDLFAWRAPLSGRFGFDPGAAWTALDAGFSPNEQKIAVASSPAVELLAAVGLQRFRPNVSRDRETFVYATWSTPLPPPVAAAACAGLLPCGGRQYRGIVVSRGSYAALGTSVPMRGQPDA